MNSVALPVNAATLEPAATAQSSKRSLIGLLGIFLAAMMAGINNRVGALALADVRGALGFGLDDASWLNTAYVAGELIAMPFRGMVCNPPVRASLRAMDARHLRGADTRAPLHSRPESAVDHAIAGARGVRIESLRRRGERVLG